MTVAERQQFIDETLEKLGEFFDSVQIFASVHEDSETLSISKGVGNYNATFGHVSLWILRQKNKEIQQ